MTPINQQTPGPLKPIPGEAYREFRDILISNAPNCGALGHAPKASEASLGYTRYRPEDARLLASAYTTFDKAGRELSLDATKLAKQLDLAALLRWANAVVACHCVEHPGEAKTPLDHAVTSLRALLPHL